MKYYLTVLFLCLISMPGVVNSLETPQESDVQQSAPSDNQDEAPAQKGYVDRLHEGSSARVKKFSTALDDSLIDMANYLDPLGNPCAENEEPLSEEDITKDNSQSVDSFFLRNKYLDEMRGSYLRLRPGVLFSSKEDTDFSLKVSAQLKLFRSKNRFKLFISELNEDNAKNIYSDEEDESRPDIGINYFDTKRYGVTSKYSLGIRGISPYALARYSTEIQSGDWLIEPIQTLRYSLEDEFKEETQIFFDTQLSHFSLMRISLKRGTETDVPGMRYDGSVAFFWALMENLGLSLRQYLNGSTKYEYTVDDGAIPAVTKQLNGIYNYGTGLTIRQNFFRKWLFYEVHPGVNFHKKYDYEANYTLRIFLDIYFGNI